MSTLVLRAQQLADMEEDPSIGTTEWNALLSEAYAEAYEAIAAEGTRYFESTHTFTTDGTNALPEQLDQLSVVDQLELVLDASMGRCRRLKPITPQQRAALSGRSGSPLFYDLVDRKYSIYPSPPSGQKLTLRYIGQAPDLTNYSGTTPVDCYCAAGQKFIVYAAAAAAVQKSKNDASALLTEREVQRKQLVEWSSDRQMNAQPVWYVDDYDVDSMPANWSW
jgi:hypothetical protein